MVTTIQVSEELKEALKSRKIHSKESYEDIIWDLIEDQLVLKDEIMTEIEKGMEEYKEGTHFSMEEVFSED